MLGEAVQTVLRAAGVAEGYERLKEFTRGRAIDGPTLAAFIDTLPLAAHEKARLRALTPASTPALPRSSRAGSEGRGARATPAALALRLPGPSGPPASRAGSANCAAILTYCPRSGAQNVNRAALIS